MATTTRRSALAGLAVLPFLHTLRACAQTPTTRVTSEILSGAGINVHHPMGWPLMENGSYIWPPFVGDHYRSPPAMIASLKAAGFNWIRFQQDVGILLASDPARRRYLLDLALERTQPFLDAGFKVVYDLQTNSSNPAYGVDKIFEDSSIFIKLIELVGEVAGAISHFPAGKVLFELINEPSLRGEAEMSKWQGMAEALHSSARQQAPELPLVLTGCNYSGFYELTRLDPAPFRHSNVFYTFHYYEPHLFTHQGIDVPGDAAQRIQGLRWPPQKADQVRLDEEFQRHGWMSHVLEIDQTASTEHPLDRVRAYLLDQYFSGADGLARPRHDMALVAQWADRHAIPRERVILGEFGARAAGNDPTMRASRLNYIRQVRSAAEANHFAWAYFDLRGGGNWSLLADGTDDQLDKGVLQALNLKR